LGFPALKTTKTIGSWHGPRPSSIALINLEIPNTNTLIFNDVLH
jgi:hypothetical protein